MKFLHAADIHLDSPRGGIDRDPDAPAEEIRGAPRRALENLVRLAIDEQVAFVLIAGDLYDGDWKDFRTGLFFVEQMTRLREADIPIHLIAGNHDAQSRITKTLKLPDNVTMYSSKRPESVRLEDYDVVIHGQSFAEPAVKEDLSAAYPPAEPGLFNIGLLHTCATKSGEHERYAPCTLEGLRSKQYGYWALGHIHKRENLHQEGEPPIVFPGNPQGRHIRETGPKGCMLVTVNDSEEASVEFRALDVFRWERSVVDANEAEGGDEVVRRVSNRLKQLACESDGRPLAVRVEITGPCAAHEQLVVEPRRWQSEIESAALQLGSGRVWIERVVRNTSQPLHLEMATDGPIGELVGFIRELQVDEEGCKNLSKELESLREKLPGDLVEGAGALDFESPGQLRLLLDDVRQILTHRLTTQGRNQIRNPNIEIRNGAKLTQSK